MYACIKLFCNFCTLQKTYGLIYTIKKTGTVKPCMAKLGQIFAENKTFPECKNVFTKLEHVSLVFALARTTSTIVCTSLSSATWHEDVCTRCNFRGNVDLVVNNDSGEHERVFFTGFVNHDYQQYLWQY